MVRVTYTGFWVPVKLAPTALAWNAYCRVPVCSSAASSLTPLITPAKTKKPWVVFLKEPGGMVTAKVPTWKVTSWVRGLMPGALLLKMKLVCRAKKSWFPAPPKARTRFAAKARKGTPGGGGTMATPEGNDPPRDRGHHRVGGRVDHRNSAKEGRDNDDGT